MAKETYDEIEERLLVAESIKRYEGNVTVADIATDTGYTLERARDALKRLSKIYISRKNIDKNKVIRYTFKYPLVFKDKSFWKKTLPINGRLKNTFLNVFFCALIAAIDAILLVLLPTALTLFLSFFICFLGIAITAGLFLLSNKLFKGDGTLDENNSLKDCLGCTSCLFTILSSSLIVKAAHYVPGETFTGTFTGIFVGAVLGAFVLLYCIAHIKVLPAIFSTNKYLSNKDILLGNTPLRKFFLGNFLSKSKRYLDIKKQAEYMSIANLARSLNNVLAPSDYVTFKGCSMEEAKADLKEAIGHFNGDLVVKDNGIPLYIFDSLRETSSLPSNSLNFYSLTSKPEENLFFAPDIENIEVDKKIFPMLALIALVSGLLVFKPELYFSYLPELSKTALSFDFIKTISDLLVVDGLVEFVKSNEGRLIFGIIPFATSVTGILSHFAGLMFGDNSKLTLRNWRINIMKTIRYKTHLLNSPTITLSEEDIPSEAFLRIVEEFGGKDVPTADSFNTKSFNEIFEEMSKSDLERDNPQHHMLLFQKALTAEETKNLEQREELQDFDEEFNNSVVEEEIHS